MKKISKILLLIVFSTSLFGQTKSKTNSTVQSKPEIDKLAEKYTGNDNVTLFTSHGELTGDVEIEYNPDEKPQSVRISCKSTNEDAVAEFLSQIIAQKRKQGYKSADGNYEPTDANWIKETMLGFENGVNFTFKKGQMYFICKGGFVLDFKYKSGNEYWFTIETGDNGRKGGKKATKFEF